MKLKYTLTLVVVIFLTGCASSSQSVPKPNLNQTLKDNETIVQLKRAYSIIGLNATASVVSNKSEIGKLANDDELAWITESNSFECIQVNFATLNFKLDDTPYAYKCFETKPKAVLKLTYDANYPDSRALHPVAFLPVFKESPMFDPNEVDVSVNITNSTPDSNESVNKKLLNAMKEQLETNFNSTSNTSVDIEVQEYKIGNTASRWVAESLEGSTFVKVKVVIKNSGEVVETFITRPVVSFGGITTVGGDEYIFDEVAEDIYLHLYGNS